MVYGSAVIVAVLAFW